MCTVLRILGIFNFLSHLITSPLPSPSSDPSNPSDTATPTAAAPHPFLTEESQTKGIRWLQRHEVYHLQVLGHHHLAEILEGLPVKVFINLFGKSLFWMPPTPIHVHFA